MCAAPGGRMETVPVCEPESEGSKVHPGHFRFLLSLPGLTGSLRPLPVRWWNCSEQDASFNRNLTGFFLFSLCLTIIKIIYELHVTRLVPDGNGQLTHHFPADSSSPLAFGQPHPVWKAMLLLALCTSMFAVRALVKMSAPPSEKRRDLRTVSSLVQHV